MSGPIIGRRRVSLRLSAAEVARMVGVDSLDLLDFEQRNRTRKYYFPPWKGGGSESEPVVELDESTVAAVADLLDREFSTILAKDKALGMRWQDITMDGWTRDEIRALWEGL